MSEQQEDPPSGSDQTGEPRSPFARPPGFQGNIGYGPPPEPAESRFAGAPHGSGYASTADLPTAEIPPIDNATAQFPVYGAPFGQPAQPWDQPVAYAPPPDHELAYAPDGDAGPRRRKPWILVAVLVLALIAGGTTIGLLNSGSTTNPSAADPNLPLPLNSATPSAGPSPNGSSAPSSPLPNVGLPTPAGLLAIGYHVYSSGLQQPADVAIDAAEQVQFKKDGLERIVGLRALTIGQPATTSDDYDADISILHFKTAAGAKAEVDYSNSRNKADSGANTIALPGLPQVTAFLNNDSGGDSIGAFATVGPYQVVLILGGLAPNAPTDSSVLAKETARVMKVLLAEASTIEPETAGGSANPSSPSAAPSTAPSTAPTPSPSATPSAVASGIHA